MLIMKGTPNKEHRIIAETTNASNWNCWIPKSTVLSTVDAEKHQWRICGCLSKAMETCGKDFYITKERKKHDRPPPPTTTKILGKHVVSGYEKLMGHTAPGRMVMSSQ